MHCPKLLIAAVMNEAQVRAKIKFILSLPVFYAGVLFPIKKALENSRAFYKSF